MHDFPTALRSWRRSRKLSQLDLASEADVSPRHIAFLETGRSRPSRGMVLRLAEVLDLPRGEQNSILTAAGFAPHYPVLAIEAAEMAQVRRAMGWMIDRHAPYPGLIMDRLWRIVAMNGPAERLFGPAGFAVGASLLDALADMSVFSRLIDNWSEVGHHTLLRLRSESARAGGIAALDRAAARLAAVPEIAGHKAGAKAAVVVPTVYRMGKARLALFSTYTQFGSVEEVALAEMKIELMFPADAEAEALLNGQGA